MDKQLAELREVFGEYADENLEQIILSKSADPALKKIKIRPVLVRKELVFQAEEFRGAQVFHANYSAEQLAEQVPLWFGGLLHQVEIHHKRADVTALISKKGTVTLKRKQRLPLKASIQAEKPALQHNKSKRYLLPEGANIPFLRELGVFTAEGRVVHARYDKYRQINRFLEFLEDVLPELPRERPLKILDFGCGKSYLTFAMYYYLREQLQQEPEITGLDLKADVIEHCSRLAEEYQYTGLHFLQGDVAEYKGENGIDMMVTLHACDTATDYALQRAVQWNAKVILSVPCCQHELNAQLQPEAMEPVLKYGIIKERMAALITDALRAELLTACGYRVQILEFIDMENTPKNLLIRAVKKAHPDAKECRQARERCEQLAASLQVRPKLMELIQVAE